MMIDCSWVRTGVSVIGRSLLLSATASVPVLLLAGAARWHTEPHQLRLLAQAALELGEAGEPSQAHHVVPQLAGRLLLGKSTDHRAEERDPVRGLEVDDRSADVLAGQHERLLTLRADFVVPGPLLVQRIGQVGAQTGLAQDRLDELPGAAPLTVLLLVGDIGGCRTVENVRSEDRLERVQRLRTVLGARPSGHPQKPQPGRVPSFVLRRKVRVVIDVGVDQPQRDETPVHGETPLGLHHPDPFAGQPAERAHRVEVEADVSRTHIPTVDRVTSRLLALPQHCSSGFPTRRPLLRWRTPGFARATPSWPNLVGRTGEGIVTRSVTRIGSGYANREIVPSRTSRASATGPYVRR